MDHRETDTQRLNKYSPPLFIPISTAWASKISMPPTSFSSSLISLTQGSRIISILTLSLWYVFVYLDSRVDVAKYLFFPWYSIILSFRRIVNMATRDSMASYAIAFLRQGTDNLLIALRSMSRYIPLAGYFFINIFDVFISLFWVSHARSWSHSSVIWTYRFLNTGKTSRYNLI